jgi:outer membrane lipoprotein SlyB
MTVDRRSDPQPAGDQPSKETTMNSKRSTHVARAALLLATLAFVPLTDAQTPAPATRDCVDCGVVRSVKQIEKKGDASGLGAVAGGVVGGVIGHQFGSGRGNTAATIAGAGAGAYAGHQVEKNRNKKTYWSVSVRMDDGATRNYSYGSKPQFREGDRVRTLDGGRRLALLGQ